MEARECMILRVLINHYHPTESQTLLNFLPVEQAQAVIDVNVDSNDLLPLMYPPDFYLSKIHYSWIQPLLKSFSECLYPTLGATLTMEQAKGLNLFPIDSLSQSIKAFFSTQLYQKLEMSLHFPIDYLPQTEFSTLLKWNKKQIVNLVDFLCLYDLATEVRHIVNRDYLKNIYNCLTAKQLHYLKICLHQKEQLVSPKLRIDLSKQDCIKLKQAMHRRGLLRLAKALCGQHPDFIWHIAHILDKGRGTLLLKDYQPKILPKVTQVLKQQVLNLIQFLKSE